MEDPTQQLKSYTSINSSPGCNTFKAGEDVQVVEKRWTKYRYMYYKYDKVNINHRSYLQSFLEFFFSFSQNLSVLFGFQSL